MKKLHIAMALTGALGGLTAQATLQIDTWTRVTGHFTGNGGEFTHNPNAELAAKLQLGTFSDISSLPGTFESFCLEESEFIDAPADIVINTKALYGGVGATGDPLSKGTSWLYSQFRLGLLDGYDYSDLSIRPGDAGRLQQAIWALEGDTAANNEFTILVENHFGSWADAIIDAAPYENNVVALNLWKPGRIDSIIASDRWQDQLAMVFEPTTTPVPEPTTIIAGALLLLPFGASTVRFLRKNRTA